MKEYFRRKEGKTKHHNLFPFAASAISNMLYFLPSFYFFYILLWKLYIFYINSCLSVVDVKQTTVIQLARNNKRSGICLYLLFCLYVDSTSLSKSLQEFFHLSLPPRWQNFTIWWRKSIFRSVVYGDLWSSVCYFILLSSSPKTGNQKKKKGYFSINST